MIRKVNQYYIDHFLQQDQQKQRQKKQQHGIVDPNRVKLLNKNNKQSNDKKVQKDKTVVKMNLFREEARIRQRQFHHQIRDYLRTAAILSANAFDQNKYKINPDQKGKGGFITRYNLKKQNINQNYPTVMLKLNTQFSQAHLKEKFQIKETYLRTPFKKQSIQFNPNQYLHPDNQFFIFQFQKKETKNINKIFQDSIQQTLASQFKQSIKRVTYYLTFFDYIYIINRPDVQQPDKIPYPKALIQIGNSTKEGKQDPQDSQQSFDNRTIQIQQIVTDHRIVSCKQDDLAHFPESLYFSTVKSYMEYKKLRQFQFKMMKVYDKDISINTDVRNIISSEKIYLIEIMKEIGLFKKLAEQAQTYVIIKNVYQQFLRKQTQFLKLICGYTKSKITTKFNIQNIPQKIHEFIFQCIKYGKQIDPYDQQIVARFPFMDIWFKTPQQLFGYQREKLHQTYYDVIQILQDLQTKIKFYQDYQKLKIKKSYIKYYPQVKISDKQKEK